MTFRFYRNDEFRIVPFTDDDFEIIKKMEVGEVWELDIKKTRNPRFHRKFFLLIKRGFANTKSKIMDKDFYRYVMTFKAGFVHTEEYKGELIPIVKSIKFDKMDELEFEKLYKAIFNQIVLDIECDEEMFKNELQSFL